LPVENCLTSASISWPLIETLSGSAFSRNWVSETGQEVLGGMTGASDQKPGPGATAERFPEVGGTAIASIHGHDGADQDGDGGVGRSGARGDRLVSRGRAQSRGQAALLRVAVPGRRERF